MEMKGTLRAEDVLAAQWLHVKPRPFYAIVGVFLLMLAASALWFSFSIPALRANGWLLAVPIALLVGCAMWVPYRVFLLYIADDAFQIIPKRFFQSETDVGLFRELLKAKIGHVAT